MADNTYRGPGTSSVSHETSCCKLENYILPPGAAELGIILLSPPSFGGCTCSARSKYPLIRRHVGIKREGLRLFVERC